MINILILNSIFDKKIMKIKQISHFKAASAMELFGLTPDRNSIRDSADVRNDVANGASKVSRGAGIVGSAATVAAAIPGPHEPTAAVTAVTATGVGFAADVLEQVARPDQRKFFIDQFNARPHSTQNSFDRLNFSFIFRTNYDLHII